MKAVNEIDVSDKRVFVRADLDVDVETRKPGGKERDIALESDVESLIRVMSLGPTIDYLLEQNCQIIVAGHRKRPTGPDPALSTRMLVKALSQVTNHDVEFQESLDQPASGKIILLENLRFNPGETANDIDYARRLARLADVYINEAFANCHRDHASMTTLPKLLPHGAGLNLQFEVKTLSKALENPKRPFVAIIGGAKIETKIPVIVNLSKVADLVLVGGLLPAEISQNRLRFGNNVVIASLDSGNRDISRDSRERFADFIRSAKTVVWNGPMGQFEQGFTGGSLAVADAIVDSGAYSIAGGGETAKYLAETHMVDGISFMSTGGGAMLEFLAGNQLPALVALG